MPLSHEPAGHTAEQHYAALEHVRGHASACRMDLPADLAGKRVLDLWCRTGKGAFKLADHVGAGGLVVGVDPSAAHVAAAVAALPSNPARTGCGQARLVFAQACPEDLRAAGLEDASFDVAYVNSAVNLAFDLDACLREAARVLVPGGYAHIAGVFAETPRDTNERAAAAAAGDVFGAAWSLGELEERAGAAGFARCTVTAQAEVAPGGAACGERFFEAIVRLER